VCTHLGCLTTWNQDLDIIACHATARKFTRTARIELRPGRPSRCPWLKDLGEPMKATSQSTRLHRHSSTAVSEDDEHAHKGRSGHRTSTRKPSVAIGLAASGTGNQCTFAPRAGIQQNIFLHLFATKVRKRMVRFSATWYLRHADVGNILILVITPGFAHAWYYHPSVPAGLRGYEGPCNSSYRRDYF